MTHTSVAIAAALLAAACSSTYRPAASPRIAIGVEDGNLTYYKNGTAYPAGTFGGGLVEAVHGNARAEDEARAARGLVIGGYACAFGALGATGAGIALTATSSSVHDTRAEVGVGLLITGLAIDVVSAVLLVKAPPHAFDAIAIYNDGIEPAPAPAAPSPAPAMAPSTR
ncbi:MAG TPA: hypothetical protein VHU80_05710 [Polyangiaceae bacterium]|nr:hypothetical protein [Polyangiaceae bacterium]